ncbi:Senescence-specific cysteine protease SAG39 [Seminavis robusta]|uniref:Senescence-specific cysteine protease SAG39 n=1 Tax=Seminavis robusta TaxID=568900 RepID=A0A9N8HE28_9STRA|nr:Senescence-specific cysteine protease SAG39 [Seminavis robusta]|eukprot:Sro453_g146200.1 Senescence-specific cysteine protease SAG39 (450) ;mRNA; f:50620-52076
MTRFPLGFWLLLTVGSVWAHDDAYYSFDDFVKEYGKIYNSDEERQMRKEIFEANFLTIQDHNNNNKRDEYSHVLAVNEWADRRIPEELPLGLHKKAVVAEDDPLNLMFITRPTKKQSTDAAEAFYQDWLKNTVVPVSELPKEVDWRSHNPKVTTHVKNQGFCGSCWAVASTEVLESHIALKTGKLFKLSPQELVSCVQNPLHCGGGGGCQGATYELAFEYVMEHGMVPEKEFPYRSGTGFNVKCSLVNGTLEQESSSLLRRPFDDNTHDNDYIDGAVATIDGYINFPTNNYTELMNAVATLGPIGVTTAASRWSFYRGGVYEVKDHQTKGATDVDHAVVLEGYGIDQESQKPFWLVRNSWGASWGEDGYIRLKRVDPSTLPDFDEDDCGIDTDPSDGAACTKDKDGHTIKPKPVKVCGTSAILYDTFVPVGGRLISNKNKKESRKVQVS